MLVSLTAVLLAHQEESLQQAHGGHHAPSVTLMLGSSARYLLLRFWKWGSNICAGGMQRSSHSTVMWTQT